MKLQKYHAVFHDHYARNRQSFSNGNHARKGGDSREIVFEFFMSILSQHFVLSDIRENHCISLLELL
jgi:hypothetical protein